MTVTKRACPIYHSIILQNLIKDSIVPDNNRRTQDSSKDKPSLARYLQEPPGVAERIALNYNASVQSGGNVSGSPVEDELMKELARLAKEGSTARSPP